MKMKYLIASYLLFSAFFIMAVEDIWPSTEQVSLVRERKANSPGVEDYVSNVNWLDPLELEIVQGGSSNLLAVQLARSPTIDEADRLAEKHDSYALIFWQDGAIRHEKYWSEFTIQSRYNTASMHKAVVAVLLGIAKDEGLIESVDDPLSRYLPEFEDTKRGLVSLRALLEMTSGIKAPPFSDDPAHPYWQSHFGNDLQQAIAHWPVVDEPFNEFFYSNANTQYLAWVIERTSGKRYATYLSEKLWKPMNAADARLWLDHPGGSPRASCCLQASARDWLKFGLLLLNKGMVGDSQIVSSTWIDQMMAPSTMNPNYGWQIWRGSPHNKARSYGRGIPTVIPAQVPFIVENIVYLDGAGGQRVYIVPSENAVIVRIGKISRTWDDSELPNLLLRNNTK
jgi:CubicO group peptidase (beta-lactamase class C family)